MNQHQVSNDESTDDKEIAAVDASDNSSGKCFLTYFHLTHGEKSKFMLVHYCNILDIYLRASRYFNNQ